ncbi:MAG: Flp1 family type IVb pilin [bacterium]|nr:Flp1 family type IVb pilin [bacterium]
MSRLKKYRKELHRFVYDESGIGVIEVILILVVLIGLVLIFKKQLTTLMSDIFKQITKQSKEVY